MKILASRSGRSYGTYLGRSPFLISLHLGLLVIVMDKSCLPNFWPKDIAPWKHWALPTNDEGGTVLHPTFPRIRGRFTKRTVSRSMIISIIPSFRTMYVLFSFVSHSHCCEPVTGGRFVFVFVFFFWYVLYLYFVYICVCVFDDDGGV